MHMQIARPCTNICSRWGPGLCLLIAGSMTLGQMVPWFERLHFNLRSLSLPGTLVWSASSTALLDFLPPSLSASAAGAWTSILVSY